VFGFHFFSFQKLEQALNHEAPQQNSRGTICKPGMKEFDSKNKGPSRNSAPRCGSNMMIQFYSIFAENKSKRP
jgi:hypothetical protein